MKAINNYKRVNQKAIAKRKCKKSKKDHEEKFKVKPEINCSDERRKHQENKLQHFVHHHEL
jgi:hypothetical protein